VENVPRVMKLRPTPSMAVALLALFVALSGISYAAVKLKANAVKTRNIKNNAVTGPKLAPNSVDASKLAANSVDSSKVADSTLTNADLAAAAQFTTQFDAAAAQGDLTGTYPAPQLGPNVVGTNEVAGGSLTTADINEFPAAHVTNTVALPQSSSSFNTLTFNTERYDNDAMHSNTTNNSRLTAPESGVYLATAHIEWENSTTGTRTLLIRKNDEGAGTVARHDTPGDGLTGISIATAIELTTGDFLEVEVRQDTGATLDVNKSSEQSPEFSLTWLAPSP
jgi:hypothetical protein